MLIHKKVIIRSSVIIQYYFEKLRYLVLRLYWELSKLFIQNFEGDLLPQYSATSQLIWRDHFYSMSFNNEYFDQMEDNLACLTIPWNDIKSGENQQMLEYWKTGKTGYPFIDAGMRQLLKVTQPTVYSIIIFDNLYFMRTVRWFFFFLGRMGSSRSTKFVGVFFD